MKKILNLSGVQKLSKLEQEKIKGKGFNRPYCKGTNMCCVRLPNGQEWCDFGYCNNGRCTWA
ncbi:hypothetical protein D1816_01870 [Aquimarina sp. AD10]|uniref:Uncharacterized protein n=1 Tax=Aquimarina aggregata TaxID=1642818 RepID=A0A163B806_9FLAO|nr:MULTISPECIES: hypothetical protein [Aquimarina]AXT59147.1 hypothetical protein D1816_01870 [Aquimarina sp. AD10]KZS41125.1 hypothetical protein AWE51_23535 [Aquimarina aggregata]RKM93854.1 hypothetical protein D7033_18895 [Aquimarina sp. AD10]